MLKKVLFSSFLSLACLSLSLAQSLPPDQQPAQQRPRVGVVLSGGGAKGAAHIGVLKYMEEQGIPVDYIVGTSMGSIIGGLYSLGYHADELAYLIAHLDWSLYIRNSLQRYYQSSERRKLSSSILLNVPFDFDLLNADKDTRRADMGNALLSSLPASFMGGSHLLNLFNRLSLGYQDSISFDSMPIPFACVATNILNGDTVVLRSGYFPMAIRASMAIPGVFSPVVMGDKLLVDGGLVNNFPTDVCRDMGADIIIGVEVSDDKQVSVSDIKSLPQLLSQLLNISIKTSRTHPVNICDVFVQPDITGYNMLSFSPEAIDSLVARGYRYAQLNAEQFAAVKSRLDSSRASLSTDMRPRARNMMSDTFQLAHVFMHGVNEAEYQWLFHKSELQLHTPISGDAVENAVALLLGTGAFSAVTYTLHNTDSCSKLDSATFDTYDLALSLTEAQPHTFGLGLRYDSEESAALLFRLGINQNRMSGFRADIALRFAYNFKYDLHASYGSYGVGRFNARFYGNFNTIPFYTPSAQSTTLYGIATCFSLFYSESYSRNWTFNLGLDDRLFTTDQFDVTTPLNPHFLNNGENYNSLGLFLNASFDNRNEDYFAVNGHHLSLAGRLACNTGVAVHSFNEFRDRFDASVYLSYKWYIPAFHDKLVVVPQLYSRVLLDYDATTPVYGNIVGNMFEGRYTDFHMPFVGENKAMLVGNAAAILRCDFRWNFYGNHYLSFMANYLHAADDVAHFFGYGASECDNWGLGLRYSFNSVIGPIAIQTHWSARFHSWQAYLSLGYDF